MHAASAPAKAVGVAGGGAVEKEGEEEPWYRGRWVKQQAVTVALMPKSKRGQLHFA